MNDSCSTGTYDVAVIGGAFSGAATAYMLRQRLPDARILVVEATEQFGHKVGEATVEVSGLFLHRRLQLYDHLSRHHLPKHGLRYWFANRPDTGLSEMSEIGPREVPRVPSFQLDRAKLDTHLLDVARDAGVEVLRPARIRTIDEAWPLSRITIDESADGRSGPTRDIRARWVIDASGRHAFLARRKRILKRYEGHPVAACWGRWNGVADLDGKGILGATDHPRLMDVLASRRLGTNHFCGDGWWIWMIPLSGGKTSIGIVHHKEKFELPDEGSRRDGYEAFLRSRPGLRELLADATPDQDDFHSLSRLPYCATQYMGLGWALVGDAAAFMDPYYSPGLDHVAISTCATVDLIASELEGKYDAPALDKRIAEHNRAFDLSYQRWIDALYVGKYDLLGDAELTACAFLVDTSLYYLGVVSPAYRDINALRNPVFGLALPQATIAYKITRAFNRRLQKLARRRRAKGRYGRRNEGWHYYPPSFGLGRAALNPLRRGLWLWLKLEFENLLPAAKPMRPLETAPLKAKEEVLAG